MLRSGEILVFRHDHLSFAYYEGLTFGTLKLDLWFLPPIYPPFRKMCVQFHDLALRFFIGMLSISCDFGEPRALDLQKIRFESVIILKFQWSISLNLWPVFFETNFPHGLCGLADLWGLTSEGTPLSIQTWILSTGAKWFDCGVVEMKWCEFTVFSVFIYITCMKNYKHRYVYTVHWVYWQNTYLCSKRAKQAFSRY